MPSFAYPTTQELRLIEQELLPRLEDGRVGIQLFPVEEVDEWELRWEQEDNYTGLQQVRGLNGEPNRVKKTGAKAYSAVPGVYGEFERIDEAELTRRRQYGTYDQVMDISDLTGKADLKLQQRELDRIELIVWTLLTTGSFAVANEAGVLHTDVFPLLTFTASPAWSTTATATPVADLRLIQLNQRGRSTSYGRQSTVYVNKKKANQLMSNSNANDLGGYKQPQNGLQRTVNLDDVNTILLAQDLPQIAVYDAGYLDDTSTFQPFIPDTKGVLVGPRTSGAPVGAYRKTRNANNPDLGPGSYAKVVDRGEMEVPRTLEVHRGHNGGPVIFFPGSITVLNI